MEGVSPSQSAFQMNFRNKVSAGVLVRLILPSLREGTYLLSVV